MHPTVKPGNKSFLIMDTTSVTKFYCGTSNIMLPVPNKAFFPEAYQDKSRLHYYASLFNSLEVNSSFYKIPMPRTMGKWAEDVPENFRFTFKLWQGITHAKELAYAVADVDRFLLAADGAGLKQGCILVQFPASIKYSLFARAARLLEYMAHHAIPRGWRIAVEFRDSSWYNDDVFGFLETQGLGLVQHDMPASAISFPDLRSDFIFLRFHGTNGDYRGSYSNEFLDEYAGYIHDWIAEGKTVFAYFNNTIGDAVHNALALKKFFKLR
jgi:uncharacterized protein YecE (DUF72 family)